MNFIKNLINYSLIIIFSLFITKSLFAEEFGTKDEAAALLDVIGEPDVIISMKMKSN